MTPRRSEVSNAVSVDDGLRSALSRLSIYSRYVLGRALRPYQLEAATGILGSIREDRGDVLTVMMSRQAGKNELGAQLEAFLLARSQKRSVSIVKAAPTFKPQIVNSILRLRTMLEASPITAGRWRGEFGYIIRVGQARILFFSTAPGSQIVGATASLLLEVDEAQDVDSTRYDRDLSPMAASTGATRVLFGTAWDDRTLLHRQIQANEVATAKDGRPRNYRFPWYVVAESNPAYGRYVEGERDRLGPEHPLFQTQYELKTIGQEDRFFPPATLSALHGDHERIGDPGAGFYVAGLDVAGSGEEVTDELARERKPRQDATVLLIGRVDVVEVGDGGREPLVDVVHCEWWTGRKHRDQYETLLELLQRWAVSHVSVDATGVGAPLAEFLLTALGEDRVEPVKFSSVRKSDLGYSLLAAAGSGRLRWYRAGPDDRASAEWWHEAEECRREVRPNRTLRFFVPEIAGHDDFISAAALLVASASSAIAPAAAAVIPQTVPYSDERGYF